MITLSDFTIRSMIRAIRDGNVQSVQNLSHYIASVLRSCPKFRSLSHRIYAYSLDPRDHYLILPLIIQLA